MGRWGKLITWLGASALVLSSCGERIHKFEGVEGPMDPTPLIDPIFTSPDEFDVGTSSRMAIFLTDTESNWIALSSGLKTIGIPFRITDDIDEALEHDVVMVYPYISGRDVKPETLRKLGAHALEGGTLIGTNVLGGGLETVFGFESVTERKDQAYLTFSEGFYETEDFAKRGLERLKIGSTTRISSNPGSNAYLSPKNEPIAIYGDGLAAIVQNNPGKGRAYALGVDFGQMLAKGYNWRQVDITEHYANEYQPVLDALLIFLENVYRGNQEHAVTLGTVPDGKTLSFILSHDVDFSQSLKNAVDYAKHEASENIEATFFIQAKYVEDFNDSIFFDNNGVEHLKKLEKLGMEIASHSVSHSLDFNKFPIGTGTEYYPDYKPFVRSETKTYGASVLGELRISKFLFEYFTKDEVVESFRPGYLRNPNELSQSLQSAGYKYSSSVTANMSLTHLPFRLTYNRDYDGLTEIFEIPITVEDELPPRMYERLDSAKGLARRIAEIEGVMVVLIHTDAVDDRLDFQRELVDEVKPYAWMGSMRQFGDWWAARDKVQVDVEKQDEDVVITLSAPEKIEGLTLELDGVYNLVQSSLPMEDITVIEDRLLLKSLSGTHSIILNQ